MRNYLGYIGAVFLIISFFFKDVKKLRFFNMLGGLLLTTQAIISQDIPFIISNGACVLVNLFYIFNKRGSNNEK